MKEAMTHGREEAAAEHGAGTTVACVAGSERGDTSQNREDGKGAECDHARCDHRSEWSRISLVVG